MVIVSQISLEQVMAKWHTVVNIGVLQKKYGSSVLNSGLHGMGLPFSAETVFNRAHSSSQAQDCYHRYLLRQVFSP